MRFPYGPQSHNARLAIVPREIFPTHAFIPTPRSHERQREAQIPGWDDAVRSSI